ncbi:MAG: DUF2330 domain-containing protein [Deltaproteobacteria bacterium]|nr:DUF2330 domain-containing protein [Deltaproteobacteria bacterium]
MTARPLRLALVSAVLLTLLGAGQAWACGGCFSPPSPDTKQTVVQNAERVLFLRDDKTKLATVWIEVLYAGLAQDFGWVLPLPKLPKVSTGPRAVFDALDQRLGFRVAVRQLPSENCRDPRQGCQPASAAKDTSASDTSGDFGAGARWEDYNNPKVEGVDVLAQGYTGPYEYAVIKGTEADKLYEWLTKAGYATPEKAKPILQIHASKGDVFLAVKLQNGQGVQAIRPIVLEMDDAEPCVPLRLTAIAAQDDMTVTVNLVGSGRAVVKNYFDVVVNPLRLLLLDAKTPVPCLPDAAPGSQCHVPSNYAQVLASAIDEAAGHAFVTEASLPAIAMGKLSPLVDLDLSGLKAAKTLLDVANYLAVAPLPLDDDVVAAIAGPVGQTGLFMDQTAADTLASLKACGLYWKKPNAADACTSGKVTLSKAKAEKANVSGEVMAASLQSSIIDPLFKVGTAIAAAARTTRLVLRISPDEMDRDPVFAFSASLPEVKPTRNVQKNTVCTQGWSNGEQRTRLSIDAMGSWLLGNTAIIDPLFGKTPAAWIVNVQDEAGEPLTVATGDIAKVDLAIAGAVPGTPSLPKDLVLAPASVWTPPNSDAILTKVGPWIQPANCTPKPGWVSGQLPPAGQVVNPPVSDAGSTTTVGDAVGSQAGDTVAPASSSCSAGRAAGWAGAWLVLTLAAGLRALRRKGRRA